MAWKQVEEADRRSRELQRILEQLSLAQLLYPLAVLYPP